MIIKSKNIILRPYTRRDVKELFQNFNDRKVTKFISDAKYPYTIKDAEKWIDFCKKAYKKIPKKDIILAVEKDKNFIGSVSLRRIKKHKAELGYWLGRKYWGKGIMAEAVRSMVNFGFRKLKVRRIYAYVFENNKRSAKVLEKNKFEIEGFLKKDRIKDNKFINVYLYAKIR